MVATELLVRAERARREAERIRAETLTSLGRCRHAMTLPALTRTGCARGAAADTAANDEVEMERLRNENANLRKALESRDVIGQAKGVIIAANRCTSDAAFDVLRQQSQHENRKLIDVAAEIVRHAQRK